MWQKFLRDYFTFSRRERNGLIVLLSMLVAITFWPSIYGRLEKDEPTDFTAFQRAIDSFKTVHRQSSPDSTAGAQTASISDVNNDLHRNHDVHSEIVLFSFDPNSVTEDEWKKLGLTDRTIQTIMKYRSKGGKFFKKEDLKRIYGVTETDYQRLEPYIEFPESSGFHEGEKKSAVIQKKAVKLLLELNAADSSQLESLNGIGAVLASRILKFRNKLGGFVSVEQLQEIYGLSPEIFEEVKGQVSADSSKIRKIDINNVDLATLKQHPYFKGPIASMVISYRTQHGPFGAAGDLKNIDLITDELLKKMIPYLSF